MVMEKCIEHEIIKNNRFSDYDSEVAAFACFMWAIRFITKYARN